MTALQNLANEILTDARALLGTDSALGNRVFLSAIFGGAIDGQDMTIIDLLRRAGLLVLARADFVQAMDTSKVAASEWHHPAGATFHFLVVP